MFSFQEKRNERENHFNFRHHLCFFLSPLSSFLPYFECHLFAYNLWFLHLAITVPASQLTSMACHSSSNSPFLLVFVSAALHHIFCFISQPSHLPVDSSFIVIIIHLFLILLNLRQPFIFSWCLLAGICVCLFGASSCCSVPQFSFSLTLFQSIFPFRLV